MFHLLRVDAIGVAFAVNSAGRRAEQGAQAAMGGRRCAAERDDVGRAQAMDEAVAPGTRPAGFAARACALAAVEAAAAVGHGRLAAGAAGARLGAAARRGQEVAAGVAVVEAAAPEKDPAIAGACSFALPTSAFALRASADEVGG